MPSEHLVREPLELDAPRTQADDDAAPQSGRHRRRPGVDWWPWLWTATALLWGWVTYRVATLEFPPAAVATTIVTGCAAFTAGYLIGERT